MTSDQMRQKLRAYAMALPDDIGVTEGNVVIIDVARQEGSQMTANELRELADTTEALGAESAADFIRACADAMDAGPVAKVYAVTLTGASRPSYMDVRFFSNRPFQDGQLLYPLAMPAQAPALRLPEPMTAEDLRAVTREQRDALLDHIYEYTTSSEGVLPRVDALARAIEAETLRRVKEENE